MLLRAILTSFLALTFLTGCGAPDASGPTATMIRRTEYTGPWSAACNGPTLNSSRNQSLPVSVNSSPNGMVGPIWLDAPDAVYPIQVCWRAIAMDGFSSPQYEQDFIAPAYFSPSNPENSGSIWVEVEVYDSSNRSFAWGTTLQGYATWDPDYCLIYPRAPECQNEAPL